MHLILLNYTKPIEEIEKYFTAHTAFLSQNYAANKFIFSGRKVPRTGGVILAHNCSCDEVSEIVRQDPFYINHVAEYEIVEFTPTRFAEAFESFIENKKD